MRLMKAKISFTKVRKNRFDWFLVVTVDGWLFPRLWSEPVLTSGTIQMLTTCLLTVYEQVNLSLHNQSPRSTQPSIPLGRYIEYRPAWLGLRQGMFTWLSTAVAAAHPNKTAPFLRARGMDGRFARHVQSPIYVDSRVTQGLETPPRTSMSHLAMDHGSRPPAAQSWTELSLATHSGPRTMEATCVNGYAPVRGMPAMMMMSLCTASSIFICLIAIA